MKLIRLSLSVMLLLAFLSGPAQATPRVVVSIKPLHSLVANVMQGVAAPELLLGGAQSAHFFNLKPSALRRIHQADIVFWVGAELETPLLRIFASLGPNVRPVSLIDTDGLRRLNWDQTAAVAKGEDRADNDHAHHGRRDPHIWLSPHNARALVEQITRVLVDTDPLNAERYRRNAALTGKKIDQLDTELAQLLAPLKSRPFIVYHDAYQHFEQHFGLRSLAAVTLNVERKPGARHVHELHELLRRDVNTCVFAEAQFDNQLVQQLAADLNVPSASLDPLGVELQPGAEAWFTLMRNLAQSLHACLQSAN